MPHRVPTGKALIPVFKEEPKRIHCPECGKSTHIHKTGDHDYFCGWCSTVIKSNAHEVDKYFEEYKDSVAFNGLGEDKE